jgi:hypothetical protein
MQQKNLPRIDPGRHSWSEKQFDADKADERGSKQKHQRELRG